MSVVGTQREPLAIPGVLYVGSKDPGVVELDTAAGWMNPHGLLTWAREVSVVAKADLTESIRRDLDLALPHQQIAAAKYPHAFRAAHASPLVSVTGATSAALIARGVRVHTVGFDKVASSFYYLGEGGSDGPARVAGDLLEMISPVLAYGSDNEDITRHTARLIDRLVSCVSSGLLNEIRLELADALPPLAAKGAANADLDALEQEAARLVSGSQRWKVGARDLAVALESATARKVTKLAVPLFGEAVCVTRHAMELAVGGQKLTLPAYALWIVSGPITEALPEATKPAAAEVDDAWEVEPSSQKPKPEPKAAPIPAPPARTVDDAWDATPSPKAPISAPKPARVPTPAPRPVVSAPEPKPAAPAAVTAMRTVSVGSPSATSAPSVIASKPITPAAPVPAPDNPALRKLPALHEEEEEEEEEDDRAQPSEPPPPSLTREEKEARAAAKEAREAKKAAAKAAKRAAAKEANRLANAPKQKRAAAKSEPEAKLDTEDEAKDAKPQLRHETPIATPIVRAPKKSAPESEPPPASSSKTWLLLLLVVVALLAAAAYVFWKRKHP